jgi:hypothetical protein
MSLASLAVLGVPDDLPSSTLFDVGWTDPSPYLPGLVAAEQSASTQLLEDGATVYHVHLQTTGSLSTLDARMEIAYTNREEDSLVALWFRAFPLLVGGSLEGIRASIGGEPVPTEVDLQEGTFAVSLLAPLAPGESLVLRLEASITVPTAPAPHYGILEAHADSASYAHVLPLLGVYDDGDWQLETPPSYGDVTYADASFFLVEIDAPAEVTLMTSGIETDRITGAQTQSATFAAGPVREFYIAADANVEMISVPLGEITVNSYAASALRIPAETALEHALAAVDIFGSLFGPYPYTELDVVASPIRAGGMEFPGIVLIGESEYVGATRPSVQPTDFFELAVAHEVGHQWFYNLVGNDQILEPWLDESVTQYATWRYFEARYGEAGDNGFAAWVDGRTFALPTPPPPIGRPVAAYSEGLYGAAIYARGPLFLKELEQELGRETLDAFFQDYVAGLRWGLTSTERFRTQLEASCSCDLAALFAEWVYGN